jgi:succinate dehydrogenase / fumarate reductase cytochrome b subunit
MPAESSRRAIRTERTRFVLSRISSLSGVLPLGLFVLVHLGSQARAVGGALGRAHPPPASATWLWVETLCVLVPLTLHALIEMFYLRVRDSNVRRYPFSRNWAWLLQRASGAVALAFVIWHFVALRLPTLRAGSEHDSFVSLSASLSSTGAGGVPFVALGYLVGLAAVVYHLANGIHGFCFTWGLVTTRDASRRVSKVLTFSGVLLFALGAATVIYFATGSLLPGGA